MKVTTSDIAKAAGVSQSTVSIVLSGNTKISISPNTRKRVLKVAESMGYQFRKRKATPNTMNIVGVLVPNLSNIYYSALLQQLERYAMSRGLTIVPCNTMRNQDHENQSFQFFRAIGVLGVLCLYSPKTDIPKDIPIVAIGEKLPGTQIDTVSLNCHAAGRIAAEHMLSLGHKDIAYITTPLGNITDARRMRLNGIQEVLAEHKLIDRLTVCAENNEVETNNTYEFDCGFRQTEKLMAIHPECTAIIAVNDMTAWGCISALHNLGKRIPEDVAVCGFDNLSLSATIQPPLTSVDQWAAHGCKIGLSMLLEKINGQPDGNYPVYMEYTPTLHARASTAGK